MAPPETPSSSPKVRRKKIWSFIAIAALVLLVWAMGVFSARLWHGGMRRGEGQGNGIVSLGSFSDPDILHWKELPRGTNTFDGVQFFNQGAIRLSGWTVVRAGKRCPGAVLNVPVQARGTRVHLLQAPEYSVGTPEGTPYARAVFHYANGETRTIELLYGVHGRDWMARPDYLAKSVSDPNTRVGWSMQRPDGQVCRGFHTALENPLPKVMMVSVDFISPLSKPNVLLFGMALNNDREPLKTAQIASVKPLARQPVTFLLLNSSGQPTAGANLAWTAVGTQGRIEFPPFAANAQGQVRLDLPFQLVEQIRYSATLPNGTTVKGSIEPEADGRFAAQTLVRIDPQAVIPIKEDPTKKSPANLPGSPRPTEDPVGQ